MGDRMWDRSGGGCAIGAALALTEDPTLLSRVETLAVFFEALGLAALAPPPHLGQLQSQVKHRWYLLDILSEGSRVSCQCFEYSLLVGLILVHIPTAHAVTVGGAEYL